VKALSLLLALLLALIPIARSQVLPDLGDVSQSELSPTDERKLGESVMREIRSDPTYSEDPEVVDYLNSLGYRLVSAGSGTRQQFNFFLVMDPQINAFALPGGFVGVNSGLIMAAENESELAGVLSHEIAHVTQHHVARMLAAQKQNTVLTLAGLAVALLAARSNSQVAQAAFFGSQAGSIQSGLNFTRENEREADRVGFQTLEKSGFDPSAMAAFFERLQRETRFSESGAPSYMRTHPLTTERIADMQNRLRDLPYKQVPDSLSFELVRAKLKAQQASPKDSVAYYEDALNERKLSEAESRYGLVTALLRAKAYDRAKKELVALRGVLKSNPMVETLAASVYTESGDVATALKLYRGAYQAYPANRAVIYGYAQALLRNRQPADALKLVEGQLQTTASDHTLYDLQAQCYAALNKSLLQHRALAESYYLRGDTTSAVEQLTLAQKSGDGDFYQQSSVDARLRQLRTQQEEERKANNNRK
jgi:predicted Zn-dependent protease